MDAFLEKRDSGSNSIGIGTDLFPVRERHRKMSDAFPSDDLDLGIVSTEWSNVTDTLFSGDVERTKMEDS